MGSALQAMTKGADPDVPADDPAFKSIYELVNALDTYIPMPQREMDKPFLMPIEDVFSITGRGTVATGRVERGTVKVGDRWSVVGISETEDGGDGCGDVPQVAGRGRSG